MLCVDLDPQAALTNMLGADRTEQGAYSLLNGAPIHDAIQETAQNIDVIAGSPNLTIFKAKEYRLKPALEQVQKSYDLIVIDTPPSFCELTFEALNAATGLIITIQADNSSIQGQEYILELAKDAKKDNRKLKVLGCIITLYDPRPKINRYMRDQIAEQAQALKCPLLGEVSRSVSYLEASALHRNIYEYAPKCKPAQEYKAIYNKIIK